jgi:hypothetical protein
MASRDTNLSSLVLLNNLNNIFCFELSFLLTEPSNSTYLTYQNNVLLCFFLFHLFSFFRPTGATSFLSFFLFILHLLQHATVTISL